MIMFVKLNRENSANDFVSFIVLRNDYITNTYCKGACLVKNPVKL